MKDLPLTSKDFAQKFLKICLDEGLKNVRIGNLSILFWI